jgi:threonylcarbamoyladenosine tRNA methylthiotransferase CDKAL1
MSLLQPVPSPSASLRVNSVEVTECQEKIFDDGFDKLTTRLETAKCDGKKRTKKVCVITNGCPENRIDCSRMQKFLGDNGCTITADIKNADIVVFNSCGLTHATQEFSVKIIKHIQALKKPSAELVVCGCLPKINMPRLKEVHQGFTFQHEIEQLKEIIETKTDPQDSCANRLSPRAHVPTVRRWRIPDLKKIFSFMSIKEKLTESYYDRLDREINVFRSHSFCIKVSTGCLNTCAYCAVRVSRGELISKPIDKVVKELEEGLAKGYKEFALLGTDVGAYGRDHGKTLVDLLRELTKKEGDYTIRIRNIQPRFLLEMLPELREILRSGKISYLSSAAQSGNNRILGLMRRGYKIEDYKEAILSLKREFPKLQIRTQIMVGFPSETEDEFEDSLRLLDEIDYDFVEVYQFQPRPNTEAAAMKDQVPAKISRRRFHKAYMKAISNLKKKRP